MVSAPGAGLPVGVLPGPMLRLAPLVRPRLVDLSTRLWVASLLARRAAPIHVSVYKIRVCPWPHRSARLPPPHPFVYSWPVIRGRRRPPAAVETAPGGPAAGRPPAGTGRKPGLTFVVFGLELLDKNS